MQEPVTKWEVQIAFRRLKNSSPGQDGIKKYHLRKFSFDDLAAHMSLWLLVGIPPASFKTGLVTLIPKNREASSPGDYRPITVGPIMSRLFHRVLASRMSTSWSLSPRQKAFCPGDGVAQNIYLIKSILQKKREQLQKLNITFTFENISLKALASSDTAIRKATRKWVHLPEDVPIPFYHTPIKYGGMGIPQLKEWVPRLRIQRLKGILSESHRGNDNFMADVFKDNVMLMKEFRKFGKDITAMPKDAWKRGVAERTFL